MFLMLRTSQKDLMPRAVAGFYETLPTALETEVMHVREDTWEVSSLLCSTAALLEVSWLPA